jgi:hypothetical protein
MAIGVKLWPDGQAVAFLDNREAIKRAKEPIFYVNEEGERIEVVKKKPIYNREKRARAHSKSVERLIFCAVRALKFMSPAACFFTVTSAGRPGAISGAEINAFFNYLRNAHGLELYFWVREKTKAGTDHLHVVALFSPGYRMQYWVGKNGKAPAVSLWWAQKLGAAPAKNSIRFGWFDSLGRRRFYLSSQFRGGYCAKYLSKDKSRGAGYRRLGVSERLNDYCKPVTYYSRWRVEYKTRTKIDWRGRVKTEVLTEFVREWQNAPENIENLLKLYRWRKIECIELGYFVYFGRCKLKIPLLKASELLDYLAAKGIKMSEN